MSKKRIAIYFRDGMKAIFDADKVAFVDNRVSAEGIMNLIAQGLRVVRLESVNWVKEEVLTDDAE